MTFDIIAYTIGALIIAAFIAAFIACPMPRINRDMFADDNDETF